MFRIKKKMLNRFLRAEFEGFSSKISLGGDRIFFIAELSQTTIFDLVFAWISELISIYRNPLSSVQYGIGV